MHVSGLRLSEQEKKKTHTMSTTHSYKDAVATIRRTTTDKNYQLVITRAYEEGEEQLLEEEEECECLAGWIQSARITAD